MYQHHRYHDYAGPELTAGKVVCVGRNYLDHIRELNNPVPDQPILFMKPSTALVDIEQPLRLPSFSRECHHELELAVLVGERLHEADASRCRAAVAGYGLALDLTLRDIQQGLKEKGQPWERAKAFDGGCPLTPFVAPEAIDPENCQLRLWVNGELRQEGNTKQMMTPPFALMAHMSRFFTLLPGDVVLTGTPAGVGALNPGDRLLLELDGRYRFESIVAD